VTGVNFGNRRPWVAGSMFNDYNQDGIRDAGEPGVAGWVVILSRPDGRPSTAVTDKNGNYRFRNLAPNTYILSESQRLGWIQTFPVAPGAYTIDISGTDVLDQNFGNKQEDFVIAGVKFDDRNGNGKKDRSEAGLEGWKIILTKPDASTAEALTAADGSYKFAELDQGDYSVSEEGQSGWIQTYPASPGVHTFEITTDSAANIDFGNRKPWITGQVFNDVDASTTRNGREANLSGWNVTLSNQAGSKLYEVTTNSKGFYKFDNLSPGTYTVGEVVQDGWMQVAPQGTHEVQIDSSDVNNVNFANRRPWILGTKFDDQNGNGVKDASESGLAGWTIKISKPDGISSSSVKAVTDSDGNYKFSDLKLGKYVLKETTQKGWFQTFPPAPGAQTVEIAAAKDISDINFGNRRPWVSGTKFEDLNGNGHRENEPGIAGWTIKLTSADGLTVLTATTDDCSNYWFKNVAPGTYTVSEESQPGMTQTCPEAPGIYKIEVKTTDLSSIDFGNIKTSSTISEEIASEVSSEEIGEEDISSEVGSETAEIIEIAEIAEIDNSDVIVGVDDGVEEEATIAN
jgi:uncharacterized protein (DUF2141 family)